MDPVYTDNYLKKNYTLNIFPTSDQFTTLLRVIKD